MASFINTMFVHHPAPFPPCFHHAPRPLPALHSYVIAASESAFHLPLPEAISREQSPLHRHIESVFDEDRASSHRSLPASPHALEKKTSQEQDGGPSTYLSNLGARLRELGMGLSQADLLASPSSNNNARSRNTAAFQPAKRTRGTSSWQLKQFAEATLGSGSLRKVVQLPEGENRDEWLAVNLVDFYNQINLLYGAITEFCSPHSCPEMKATDEYEYLWHDPPTFPKPTRLPAPTYIGHLLTWTSSQLSNPSVFPTQPGVPFPENFEKTVRVLFKRLYRIYAHIYCHHYSVVRGLGLEAHLNTGFKHYVLFVEEFGLAEEKGAKKNEWFGPLGELVESMLRSD